MDLSRKLCAQRAEARLVGLSEALMLLFVAGVLLYGAAWAILTIRRSSRLQRAYAAATEERRQAMEADPVVRRAAVPLPTRVVGMSRRLLDLTT